MTEKTNKVQAKLLDKLPHNPDVYEKKDKDGNIWNRVYTGSGTHFKHWLEQCQELGEIEVEEVEPTGFTCFEEAEEKMYTIWMKQKKPKDKT